MDQTKITHLVTQQRNYFYSGKTLSISHRISTLRKLKNQISLMQDAIHEAIKKDLGKSSFESYMCETGLVLSEISYMLRHIRRFSQNQTVHTPLSQFRSKSFQKRSPYGVVLIMSPWNYPFLLSIEPLVDALAAGNTAILKPSAYSPHTSALIADLIKSVFPEEYVCVVNGGREENKCLLEQHFDYIFFTGSQTVGKEVMRSASSHLTPVTLELGGKSPCIVERTADLSVAARRIVFGKFLNCGQTCVAPDYIYCDEQIKDALTKELILQIQKQFGASPLTNTNYGKIINQKHFDRILSLIEDAKVLHGGDKNASTLQIEPTIMGEVTFEDAVMKQEIFGPVLPILTYHNLEEAVHKINSMPHPLALYIFTTNKKAADYVTSRCSFGGGCINDTIIHLATSELGFGGFGESGMGAYHGKEGFLTFSHTKSIVDKKIWPDLSMRYQPYTKQHEKMLRKFLK